MKVFEKDGKINFVDENNKFVGFDYEANCCEYFGWFVTGTLQTVQTIPHTDAELDGYLFDGTQCLDVNMADVDEGGAVAFGMKHPVKGALFLILYNHHNGYYSHGFEFDVGNGKGGGAL